jgi:opacity protein-like surface antigen
MTMKSLPLVSAALIFTVGAVAQDHVPRFEVYGDYSYMQFNPTVSGLNSKAFNGGGGGGQINFGHFFAIKGDFQGYGSTNWTETVSAPIVTPHGTVPVGTYTSRANMFTYMFGPAVGMHVSRLYAYGEVLMGGSNSTGYVNLAKAIDANGGTVAANQSQHPFTMAVGGGVDFKVHNHVALRLAELDWMLTRYTNPITSTNNQNSFRYLGGVVFTFGGE